MKGFASAYDAMGCDFAVKDRRKWILHQRPKNSILARPIPRERR